jgi:isoleucyl-tRNA synthetase
MQNIILLGRKIRDNKKISLKTPLYKAVIVESNPIVIEGLKSVAQYIKDELNCLDIEFQTNEEEYVIYKSEPENELCG